MPEETQWEYNFAPLDAGFADRERMLAELNAHGAYGWELVALAQYADRLVALLKRPATAEWADSLRSATG